jgi:hypothetical protein
MHSSPRPGFAPLASILAVSLVAGSGCASSWRREYLAGEHPAWVYREYRMDGDARVPLGHDHPANVAASELEHVLEALTYEEKSLFASPEPVRVFEEQEVRPLAGRLEAGLATVTPDERVRFLIVRRHFGTFLTGLEGVSGVAFVSGARLHLAFDTIGGGIHEGDSGRPEEVKFPYDPTEERYSLGLLPPFEYTALHSDPATGETRKRWIEIDLSRLASATHTATAPSEVVEPESPRPEASAPPTTTVRSPGSAEAVSVETDPGRAPASEVDPGAADDPRAADPVDLIAERLRTLKRLRESGALSDEEYQREYERALTQVRGDGSRDGR